MYKKLIIGEPFFVKATPAYVNIWLNELPNITISESCETTVVPIRSNKSLVPFKCAIEIYKAPYFNNSYGLLGFEFIPKIGADCVEIIVAYTAQQGIRYYGEMKPNGSYPFMGLYKEWYNGIVEGKAKKFIEENGIPAGTINFKVAANCGIGSSPNMFMRLTEMLLKLLQINTENIKDEELTDLILKTF